MSTLNRLCIAFNATESQIAMIKDFCMDKRDEAHYIALAQGLPSDKVLCLSFFAGKPKIYFGVYSRKEKRFVPDAEISDDELRYALKALDVKYDFNTTRENPVGIKEIVYAWMEYINRHPEIEELNI